MNIRPQEIQIADYDYPLPDERIAKYPLADRSSSKLLRYQAGEIEEFTFRDLPRLLPEGAVLVRNNSKVIRARSSSTRTQERASRSSASTPPPPPPTSSLSGSATAAPGTASSAMRSASRRAHSSPASSTARGRAK